MKTFIIGTSPEGASDADYFFAFGRALYRRGHRVIIVTDKKRPDLLPLSTSERMKYHSWPSKRPVKIADFRFCCRLYRKYRPDVVLGNFGATNVMLMIGRIFGVKNRITYWHTIFADAPLRMNRRDLRVWLLHQRKKRILNLCATHILTNSEETRNYLMRTFGFAPGLLHKQILLIPDNPFAGPDLLEEQRANIIAFVGRLDRLKGQDVLIRAIPEILAVLPDTRFYFLGSGPFETELRKMVSERGVEEQVVFTGRVPLRQVYETVRRSKVHVSASVYEGFGLVNVEAMSVGTPIVARPVGGITEILEDGYNGLFFDTEVAGDLVGKLLEIMGENWAVYAANARESFVRNFSIENIDRQVDDFEKLLVG